MQSVLAPRQTRTKRPRPPHVTASEPVDAGLREPGRWPSASLNNASRSLERRNPMNAFSLHGVILASLILPLSVANAEVPDAIAAPGETLIASVHAEGAQVYECKADAGGQLVWQFREPIATLLIDGKTVGRHFAGPSWELVDGSAVTGKVTGRAAGATPKDIPLLRLEVTSRRGNGRLAGVATVQRLNTKGGVGEGRVRAPATS
jgi:hypothetical protein